MANNLSANFRRWIKTLESLRNSVFPTAVIRVLQSEKRNLHNILWREVQLAISINEEFDYPAFKAGLKKAVYDEAAIVVTTAASGGSNILRVSIDMDTVAGTIHDYASAVESVRAAFSGNSTRRQASAYWRNFIYGQAREGFKIKQKRSPGQLGRTPLRRGEGTGLYSSTIEARLALLDHPAPFWEILDKGIAGARSLDAGGDAYPRAVPTNFVQKAESEIFTHLVGRIEREQQSLFSRLEAEEFGGQQILLQLQEVIGEFKDSNISWQPGTILRELEIGERQYNAYITSTGKLGLTRR